jgi:hypothetical protein
LRQVRRRPERGTAARFGLQIPIRRRNDAHFDAVSLVLAEGGISPISIARSNIGCSSSGSAPISSRKRVPPLAASNAPSPRSFFTKQPMISY